MDTVESVLKSPTDSDARELSRSSLAPDTSLALLSKFHVLLQNSKGNSTRRRVFTAEAGGELAARVGGAVQERRKRVHETHDEVALSQQHARLERPQVRLKF